MSSGILKVISIMKKYISLFVLSIQPRNNIKNDINFVGFLCLRIQRIHV